MGSGFTLDGVGFNSLNLQGLRSGKGACRPGMAKVSVLPMKLGRGVVVSAFWG